jgi:hypothetical protein
MHWMRESDAGLVESGSFAEAVYSQSVLGHERQKILPCLVTGCYAIGSPSRSKLIIAEKAHRSCKCSDDDRISIVTTSPD